MNKKYRYYAIIILLIVTLALLLYISLNRNNGTPDLFSSTVSVVERQNIILLENSIETNIDILKSDSTVSNFYFGYKLKSTKQHPFPENIYSLIYNYRQDNNLTDDFRYIISIVFQNEKCYDAAINNLLEVSHSYRHSYDVSCRLFLLYTLKYLTQGATNKSEKNYYSRIITNISLQNPCRSKIALLIKKISVEDYISSIKLRIDLDDEVYNDSLWVYNYVGYKYLNNDINQMAYVYLNKANDCQPTDEVYRNLSYLYFRVGLYQKSVEWIKCVSNKTYKDYNKMTLINNIWTNITSSSKK